MLKSKLHLEKAGKILKASDKRPRSTPYQELKSYYAIYAFIVSIDSFNLQMANAPKFLPSLTTTTVVMNPGLWTSVSKVALRLEHVSLSMWGIPKVSKLRKQPSSIIEWPYFLNITDYVTSRFLITDQTQLNSVIGINNFHEENLHFLHNPKRFTSLLGSLSK